MPPPPPPPPSDAAPLPLHVVARQAFLWAPADIAAARAAHHIAPMLQGTLPMLAQQNLFCGPPAGLMHEEAVCLVARRAAVLIASPESHDAPSTSQAAAYHAARRASIAAQRAATRASSSAARSKQLTTTRAAQEKREARAARRAAAGEAPEEETRPASPASQLDDEEISYSHLTPALPDGDWYAPEPHTYTTLAAARKAGVWTFPADLRERARAAVFEEMHRRGYFLNCGLRFGGDFNAYPGDPLRYHSHFTVQVLATPTTPLPAQQLVASGRLGTAVKKAHLLAVVDGAEEADEEGKAKSPQVTFWSLTWAGFGT